MLGMWTSRFFSWMLFNQKCLDCQTLMKAGCLIHLLTLKSIHYSIHPKAGIATRDLFPDLPNHSFARWCGNWTCHWTMIKSKKSSNLLIGTRQDQHHLKLTTGLRLLLLHNVGCIELPCYFTQLCFKLFESFSIPFNSRMASWPMRSIWSWWCWVFSVSSRQSRHQRVWMLPGW